jgi:hypothetical protein
LTGLSFEQALERFPALFDLSGGGVYPRRNSGRGDHERDVDAEAQASTHHPFLDRATPSPNREAVWVIDGGATAGGSYMVEKDRRRKCPSAR